MKKFVLALLAVVLVLGLSSVAFAAHEEGCNGATEIRYLNWTDQETWYDSIDEIPCGTDYRVREFCVACGERLAAHGTTHTKEHDYENKVTAPVCESWGKMWKVCTICGAETDIVDIYKDHELINEVVIHPTCTTDGKITYDCADCDKSFTITAADDSDLKATGHQVGQDGKAGHFYREQDKVDATCTEPGYIIYTCNHVDPNTGKTCDYTATAYTAKKDHKTSTGASAWVFSHDVAGEEVTCTEDGLGVYVCSECGAEKVDVVKHSGHKFKDWEVRVEATCELPGLKYRECTVCKDTRNGKYFEETEVIPALDHDIAEWATVTAATCTTGGERFGACQRCLKTVSEPIPALEHDPSEWTITDCYKTRTCERPGCEWYEVVVFNCPAEPDAPVDPEEPEEDDDDNESEGGSSSTGSGSDASIPATGDNTSNVPYIMMVAAVAGLVVLVASKRKVNC